MLRPRILDLFCGAGGAAMGLHRAGFDVLGVDIKRQPHYPFAFDQADALTYPLDGFDAYWASPPCQRFSKSVDKKDRTKHPDYIDAIRQRLIATGKPYIIENVPQAPLINSIQLCGSSFGLRLHRHRIFEGYVPLLVLPCSHSWMPADLPCAWNRKNPLRVYAVSGGWQHVPFEDVKKAMGIEWEVTPKELSEAIPPAYSEFLGKWLQSMYFTNK